MKEDQKKGTLPPVTRRGFLKGATLLGGGAVISGWGLSPWIGDVFHRRGTFVYPDRPPTWPGVETVYSVCKQCGSDCGLEAHVFGGVLQKLDGNPYHPASTEPHALYATDVSTAAVWPNPHSLCPRGQAGRQTVYDPYRVTAPLKRVGPRGSGQWEVIPWTQLIREVVEGGTLFRKVKGDNARRVKGFADLYDGGRNQSLPIDPRHPDMGPKTNGLVIYVGEAEAGQSQFIGRFANTFGTVNVQGNGQICNNNVGISYNLSTSGQAGEFRPDVLNAEYVIWFGLNALEANFPMQALGRKVVEAVSSGRLKYHMVDVRAGNALIHADSQTWVRPGGDGALAMGMIRWILDHQRYNEPYLTIPNAQAATAQGEPNYTNATWLVVSDATHPNNRAFLTAAEAGLVASSDSRASNPVVWDATNGKPAIATQVSRAKLWSAQPMDVTPVAVAGVSCQTSFQILAQEAMRYTLSQYAVMAGTDEQAIARLAQEVTSHGRRAVVDFFRGAVMHTNGVYAGRALMTLNMLIGNVDWMGGYIVGGGGADILGTETGQPYQLKKWPRMTSQVPAGVTISRNGTAYETTSYYQEHLSKGTSPYPAQRPWFPFSGGLWEEMFAGIYEGYPYPCEILVQHIANPAWSAPGIGGADDEDLPWPRLIKDIAKVPLFIAIDTQISESSRYADYIVPDTTYLEGWGFPSPRPVIPTKATGVRYPVIEPLTQKTPAGEPMSMEQFFIDVAKALSLPGFGARAFLEGGSLDTREDYYLKMVANVAWDRSFLARSDNQLVTLGPVPDAEGKEISTIGSLRSRYQDALTDVDWAKVTYVLARGGRFEDYNVAYLPNAETTTRLRELMGHQVLRTGVERWAKAPHQVSPDDLLATYADTVPIWNGGIPSKNPSWVTHVLGTAAALQIYNPDQALAVNALTGTHFLGTGSYQPPQNMLGQLLSDLDPTAEFSFVLSTRKETVHSKGWTIADPWLLEMLPEAFIDINPLDADRLNLRDGDVVRVSSRTYPRGLTGRLRLLSGVRPGVVSFPHSYGHWYYGSGKWTIDGQRYQGDASRNAPVRLNAVMRLDPSLAASDGWTIGLEDPIGGGCAYFETPIRIQKV
ncbi:MAG: molybdopterin-dependent oxidoreductase [Firmicutes bacterium]|nr:molybdopterin-dependent oxidoreductase [Bacillota bacterium]